MEFLSSEIVWFILGIIVFIGELATPGFILVFFGVGAWITALGVIAGILPTLTSQLLVFIVASGASLFTFRKKGKDIFRGKVTKRLRNDDSLDDYVGGQVIVTSDISPGKLGGKVECHGTQWNAESDEPISKGANAIVTGRKNLTLIVSPSEKKGA